MYQSIGNIHFASKEVAPNDISKGALFVTVDQQAVLSMAGLEPEGGGTGNYTLRPGFWGEGHESVAFTYYGAQWNAARPPDPRIGRLTRRLTAGMFLFVVWDGCDITFHLNERADYAPPVPAPSPDLPPAAPPVRVPGYSGWQRDTEVMTAAKERAGYRCEYPDCTWLPFTDAAGFSYVETHHTCATGRGRAGHPGKLRCTVPGVPQARAPLIIRGTALHKADPSYLAGLSNDLGRLASRMDIVDPQTRSRMMSAIKGKNTSPELAVRRYLHARGFRFRLHRRDLPGKPDLVLPKYRLVIFVHGCFWHRHEGCFYATTPATRKKFWRNKLDSNAVRDKRQEASLISEGWRVLVIWECGLKHKASELSEVDDFILSDNSWAEWPPLPPRTRKKE